MTPPEALPRLAGVAAARRPLPLRPMALGDLLDGSVKLFRADWRAVLLATAAVVVPVQVVVSWLQRDAFEIGLLPLFGDPAAFDAFASRPFPSSAGLSGFAAGIAVSTFVLPVLVGAVCAIAAGSYTGAPIGWSAALKTARARVFALIGAAVLVRLAAFAPLSLPAALAVTGWLTGGIPLSVIGVGLMALGVIPAYVISALLAATPAAIVAEGVGPVEGLRRSWRLRRSRVGATAGAALIAALFANVIAGMVSFPLGMLALGFGGAYSWVLAALAGILGQLVSLPYLAIFSTLLYFDGRFRCEGLDLLVLAGELDGASARP